MTIPSRPAPAPPINRAQNAAAGANASIEQLRLQLQQQQQQQQQNGGIQKFTIKLPPPPKASNSTSTNNSNNSYNHNIHNNNSFNISNSSSITRKFPQARYTPTTNWSDAPFDLSSTHKTGNSTFTNGNLKRVPPPRPPPPKVQVNGRKPTAAVSTSNSHITNSLKHIFQRKASTANNNKTAAASNASRVYGLSAGSNNYNSSINSNTVQNYNTVSSAVDWNAAWNDGNTTTTATSNYSTSSLMTSSASQHTTAMSEAQLISFDSPPSSPTFTQKSNSDCVSVDSFSSDSNFSSPNNGSVSQPESGFEDDFSGARSRPATTSPLDPWETFDAFGNTDVTTHSTYQTTTTTAAAAAAIGTAPVRNLNTINTRMQASSDNLLCNGKNLIPPTPSLTMPTIIKPKISQKPKAPKPPVFSKHALQQYYGTKVSGIATANTALNDAPPSPPMPQCAPPPPPTGISLFDIISGKVDAVHLDTILGEDIKETSQPYGIALYDFEGVEDGDLSFKENEKIYLIQKVSDEWYQGHTRAGCEGIFPANYLDIKVPLPAAIQQQITEKTAATTTTLSTTIYKQQQQQQQQQKANQFSMSTNSNKIRCLYNFPAEVEGDLELKENDLVSVLYKINEDWLFGEINGRQGQFPANFLEYVPDNIP